MNSANQEKVIRVLNGVVAGTSQQTSAAIDTQGYEGVKIYTALGAITSGAATGVKVSQCDTTGGSYADLLGTNIVVADDDGNQVVVHDIYRPREQFLKVVITRADQNVVIDGIIAVLYGAREMPTTDDTATVVARETHVSPAEGTA